MRAGKRANLFACVGTISPQPCLSFESALGRVKVEDGKGRLKTVAVRRMAGGESHLWLNLWHV